MLGEVPSCGILICSIPTQSSSDFDLKDISSKHGVTTRPGHLLPLVFHSPVLEPNLKILLISLVSSDRGSCSQDVLL